MSRCRSLGVVFVAAVWLYLPAQASAQLPLDRVKLGMNVSVVDEAGQEIEGRVDSVSDDVLRLRRRGRIQEVALPAIVRIEKPDSLRNGAWTGAIIGGTGGLVMTVANNATLGVMLWATAANAAVYAGIGTAIDGIVRGRRTLYERGRVREVSVAPIVGPHARGASVRVSW